jgi:hypothetical protein
MFWILQGYFKCVKVIKFKRNLKTLIIISIFDISSIVKSFKIIRFKRNFKKLIMIYVLDISSNSKFQNYNV